MRYTPDLAAAVVDLASVLAEVIQAQEENTEPPMPWLLVCADAGEQELWHLADLMGKSRGHQIAAVLPATDTTRTLFPDALELDASLTEPQPYDALQRDVALQRVTDQASRQMTATLTTTAEPARPAQGVWATLPTLDPAGLGLGPTDVIDEQPSPARPYLSLIAAEAAAPADQPAANTQPTDPDTAAPRHRVSNPEVLAALTTVPLDAPGQHPPETSSGYEPTATTTTGQGHRSRPLGHNRNGRTAERMKSPVSRPPRASSAGWATKRHDPLPARAHHRQKLCPPPGSGCCGEGLRPGRSDVVDAGPGLRAGGRGAPKGRLPRGASGHSYVGRGSSSCRPRSNATAGRRSSTSPTRCVPDRGTPEAG
ncbi:hypothetical protein AB0442_37870 [Kitasatospora sp. NPDC085895]|uniref:hypothetical protein n=1 Tax=Kitasatospora sp. NPDC085895 TaxID=3155057 RepID=UPI00344D3901